MKKIFLFMVMFVMALVTNSYAQIVSVEKAQKIGESFVKESTKLGAQKSTISSNLSYTFLSDDGQACIYAFNIDGGGFVLVSAENRVKPILAYSNTGSFDASNLADGFGSTINSYKFEINYIREKNIAITQDIVDEWRLVEKEGRIVKDRSRSAIEPLVETTWNQNYPYNYLCPLDELGNGGRVYAGCVATAMAQVIRYWNHPVVGTSSHSYTPYGYPTQMANFGETFYNYENMPIFLDSLSTEEEIYDVALLQWHCGIAVEMMYGNDGSGAFSFDVPVAMNRYFGCSFGDLVDMWGYSNEEWAELLKVELNEKRPIYYSGQDDYGMGGHAFVCDGYDENNMFHFNWGWGGRDDAYCAIGALNTTKYSFNSWNDALFENYPITDDYFNRPDRIENMTLTEIDGTNSVVVSWTNPTKNIEGANISSLDTVFVRRDFEVVATFTNAQIGESMSFTDEISEEGLYEYSVYVNNEVGNSKPVYQTILVGEKCDMMFEMQDEGGDGWKGGSISVFKNDERIAIITMDDGSSLTETVPLLRGDLTFVWNKCWYKDQYYTCDEISFVIKDSEEKIVYVSEGELEPGILFEYENNCNSCDRPQNLAGEYYWELDSFGVTLSWELESDNLEYFNVFVASEENGEYTLLEEIEANSNNGEYEYAYEIAISGTYYYQVRAYHIDGTEVCESLPGITTSGEDYVVVNVTSLSETVYETAVYPNPTTGLIYIESNMINSVSVYNLVGQEVIYNKVEADNHTLDMSQLLEGLYFVKINTENGIVTKRIVLTY